MQSDTTPIHFDEMSAPPPDLEALRAEVEALRGDISRAHDDAAAAAALERWDARLREIDTWAALTIVHFHQDTESELYQSAREHLDAISATLNGLEVELLRELLDSPHSDTLGAHFGDDRGYLVERWRSDVASFDPAIAEAYTHEKSLTSRYTTLTSGVRVEIDGESMPVTRAQALLSDPDAAVRERAARAIWAAFEPLREELDRIFDELVTARAEIARILGHDSFTPVGYLRMSRIGYDADDVARFRREVLREVVPLVAELRTAQARTLGLDTVHQWDESIWLTGSDPRPTAGDIETLLDDCSRTFHGVHPEIGGFFDQLRACGLVDLEARDRKSGGGFCIYLPQWQMPFIFGNFNGTRHGVRTIVHELGHAYQKYKSRDLPLLQQARPTFESAEIHSMSLEFLCHPTIDRVFGDDAGDWRTIHLSEALCFLPYGVAVDHFQHEIYARPELTPDQRAELWKEMEATYLPWRTFGDVSFPASGRYWQRQRHIYRAPFYYIDYVLAQTCALQFWADARNDHADAVERYIALCSRGGTAPFADLAESAGLTSPFEPGCLRSVVDNARTALEL